MQDPLGGIDFAARGYTQRTELAGALRAAHERLGATLPRRVIPARPRPTASQVRYATITGRR